MECVFKAMKALSCTDYISLFQSSKHSDVIKHFNDQFSSSLEDPEITKIAAASYFVLGDLTKCFELLSSVNLAFLLMSVSFHVWCLL